LTVLRAAFKQARLDLESEEVNWTIFAPTDEAFDKVPADVLNALLTNYGFVPHLHELLIYHVLPFKIFAYDMSSNRALKALNGEGLFITSPPIVVIGNKVDAADIEVSNGVIHLFDGVLSISDRVVADSDLRTIFALVGMVGLSDALAG
jgi:uncharacterized surface protein with fasciclin (FAS1) repeats